MKLEGKVAIVTGASSGLGESIAYNLAENGCNVVITYNVNYDGAKKVEEKIKNEFNVDTMIVQLDLESELSVDKMISEVINKYEKIDILVNNAGIAIDTIFEDKTVENFKKILNVNLIGTFLCSKYVSKYMLNKKSGTIINIASTNGIDTNYPESMDYDASKAGVISLTKNLALELAPYIRVNAVAPGWINTPMNKALSTEFVEKENDKIFLNRFADPDEIAKVVTFLASNDASYVNGTVIRVDGGSK